MMTELVLEGSDTKGCLHELKEFGFCLTHPFVFVRVII